MTRPRTPLPDLERELVAAARRREGARAPRRRAWLHGWTLVSIVLATTGIAGVAVARVAEVGPFAYLGRFAAENPKTAPVSAITVQPGGPEPAWQAIAVVDKLGRLCFTGGPRDPRTNPDAKPTATDLNNPPASGYTCSDDSAEAAEILVDPDYPGATFGGNSAFDGSPNQGMARSADGKLREVPRAERTTKLVVYAVAPAELGTVVARWSTGGATIPLQRSEGHLRLKVDKSPEGLDPDEQVQVARYPDELDLVLWAAVVDIPEGVESPQVSFPAELPPHGVPDNVVELLDGEDMSRLYEEGNDAGFKYDRGITREPTPVRGESAAQRKKIGAFARPHAESDVVPEAERPKFLAEHQRVQYRASRKLRVAGGGLDGADAWLVPGALPEAVDLGNRPTDLVCTVGPAILGQCKYGVASWKDPLVEAVTCARSFAPGETFVWALTPPRAARIELLRDGAQPEELPLAELVALRRPFSDQPTSIRWTLDGGGSVTAKVPWAKQGVDVCGKKPPAYTSLRLDNAGTSSMGGGPAMPHPPTLAGGN